MRVYTKGAPDVLFGKDAKKMAQARQDVLASHPDMSAAEVTARASKAAGYGMVT